MILNVQERKATYTNLGSLQFADFKQTWCPCPNLSGCKHVEIEGPNGKKKK